MEAPSANQRHSSPQCDLFALASQLRAAEIERYRADPSIPAPVVFSVRDDANAKINWPKKF